MKIVQFATRLKKYVLPFKSLGGQTFSSCKYKRKDQISSLKSLYSSIQKEKENVTIDTLTLFLRLLVVVEKKPENEMANYFNYKLTPYPMSLFKDGEMCSTKKSAFKTFLLKNVKEADPTESTKIIDGGTLLWCCEWKRNKMRNLSKNNQIFLVITLLILLCLMDMLHQSRTRQ